MRAAERIAEFALGVMTDGVPKAVSPAARLHLLDALGVGLAASTVAGPDRWARGAAPGGGALLAGGTAEAGTAAMMNGALIHALEFDDTHIGSVVHGSAVAAPLALAVVQEAGASGPALLGAYATVWEVAIRIGLAAPGAFQARGFQVTSVAGAVAAAAAAGAAMGLARGQIVSAIGIACGQASGTLAFLSDGSASKALNPGWAARTGIEAARLAAAGMTGPTAGIEGKFGLFDAFAGAEAGASVDAAAKFDTLGEAWHLPEAAFKLYPCCHYIHPFLEALEEVIAGGVRAEDVRALTCEVPPPVVPLIAEPWERRQAPASGYDGKWGLAYCLALMLVDGRVDVASFEAAPREDVIAVARRIGWRPMAAHGFPARFAAALEVETGKGVVRAARAQVLGAPERPVAEDAVLAKFRANAARRLAPEAVAELEKAVMGLDRAADIGALVHALSG